MIIKNKEILIKNGTSEKNQNGRRIILELLEIAINNVNPKKLIDEKIRVEGRKIDFNSIKIDTNKIENIYVLGAGKASGYLAEALEEKIGNYISQGLVVVLSGTSNLFRTKKIRIIEASHPIPDEKSIIAANELLKIIEKISEKDLVICLLTGGGSALITCPPEGISIEEMSELNEALLACGANIKEINSFRKHLSKIGGGRLAEKIYPAYSISFIISDVVGDQLDTISSGPTTPDKSTFLDVLKIIDKYQLKNKIPASILNFILDGIKSKNKETPKPKDKIFQKAKNFIIGSNINALKAVFEHAKEKKLNPIILSSMIEGEAVNLGIFLSSITKEVIKTSNPLRKPALIISGGETVVNLTKLGIGGRNQTVALSALINLIDEKNITICCSSTDGVDGNSRAAGALVDDSTFEKVKKMKLEPLKFLSEFNSNLFFKKVGDEIITGPTGTNVNDINLILIQ